MLQIKLVERRDDAAGEAFDKAARAMGFSYPGGVFLDQAARQGDPSAYKLPRPKVEGSPYDFSFSGLKTAVINYCHTMEQKGEPYSKADVAASFQCAAIDVLVEKTLDPALVPELCAFAAAQDIAILTYNREGIVCERDKDEWANKECFTTKLPMIHVDDLASYVNYPVCKMLITLDPARRDAVCAAGQQQFAGRADLYPSSPFFIEAVPLGVAKDGSLAELLRRMGLTRENLMACGDGLNDRSMIAYAGVGVAMQNAEQPVKDCADYVTTADNNHDGVAEAVEKFILREE